MPLTPKRPVDRVKREGSQNEPDNERKKRHPDRDDRDDDGIQHIDEYV